MKINVLMFINGDLNTLLLHTPYLGVIYYILASLGGVHTPLNSPSRWRGIYLSPFEMCAVASFVRRGARSYVWRVIKLPVDI